MNNKEAIIVCDFNYKNHPLYDTVRCYGLLFNKIGYECQIINFSEEIADRRKIIEEGVDIVTYGYKSSQRCSHYQERCYRNKVKKNAISSMSKDFADSDVALYFGENCGLLWREIYRFSKDYEKLKMICFIGEWFDVRRLFQKESSVSAFISSCIRLFSVEYSRRIGFIKSKNLIVVSRALQAFYKRHRCNCIRIPNLLRLQEYKEFSREDTTLRLGYFGTPGMHNSKDQLNKCIEAIYLLSSEEKSKLEFHIYGATKEDLYRKYDVPERIIYELNDVLFAHGRVSREEVRKTISLYDFTLLLRENTFSINCGLSSKMEESMAFGVPLICNLTSDMNDYITDKINGLICENNDSNSLATGIRRALKMSREDIDKMKKNAYSTAMEKFSYDSYINKLEEYIKNIGNML